MFGHGYPVALLDEEKILPVGKEISVLELHKLNDEGVIEIKLSRELPCFLSELTKAEVEADLALNVKILLWSGLGLGGLSVDILELPSEETGQGSRSGGARGSVAEKCRDQVTLPLRKAAEWWRRI